MGSELAARAGLAFLTALLASPAMATNPGAAEAGAVLAGSVVDSLGQPVPGARIFVQPGVGSTPNLLKLDPAGVATAVADGDGRFSARTLGGTNLVVALLPGPPSRGTVAVTTVPLAGRTLRLVVGGTERIEGRLSDGAGQPVAGATVRAIPLSSRSDDVQRGWGAGISRKDGRFVIDGVDSGSYRIDAWGSGHRGTLEPVTGGDRRSVLVELQKEVVVSGRLLVVANGRKPATRFVARLPYSDRRDLTSPDGRFALPLMRPTQKVVIAFSVEGLPSVVRRADVVHGKCDLGDVVIGEGRTLRGRVVAGDVPVAGATIQPDPESDLTEVLGRTRADGSFELRVADGDVRLLVRRDIRRSKTVEVAARQNEVTIDIGSGATVRMVLDDGERPIPDVQLGAYSEGRHETCVTDATGRCSITGLDAGTCTIHVSGASANGPQRPRPSLLAIDLGETEVRNQRLAWPKSMARLAVEVVQEGGSRLPLQVMVYPGEHALTDLLPGGREAGAPRYLVGGAARTEGNLPPGRYTAFVLDSWGIRCARSTIDLSPGERRALTLELKEEGCQRPRQPGEPAKDYPAGLFGAPLRR